MRVAFGASALHELLTGRLSLTVRSGCLVAFEFVNLN